MADEAKAPAKETKAPLNREFRQKGADVQVNIVPIDESDSKLLAKTLEVAFGEFATWREGEEEKIAGRYQVTYPRVVDGVEEHIVVLGADPKKAIAGVISQSNRGTIDDYSIEADFEEDFWKQKITAPKEDANDVWSAKGFADIRENLAELRGTIEGELEAVQASSEATQDDYRAVSNHLCEVHDLIASKNSSGVMKSMTAWIAGMKGGDNMPLLTKLGKGVNAIREAMFLGRLADEEYAFYPVSVTSGKAAIRHRMMALKSMTEDAGVKCHKLPTPNEVEGRFTWGIDEIASYLKTVAQEEFGIEDAGNLSLSEVSERIKPVAAAKAAEFMTDYGKAVNTYDKTEYKYALKSYGRYLVAMQEFDNAMEALETANGMEDAEKQAKEVASLTNRNLLVKYGFATASSHAATVKAENANRAALQEVEAGDDTFSKSARKTFANMEPHAAAMRLFELTLTHQKAAEVASHYSAMCRQFSEKLNPQKDAA